MGRDGYWQNLHYHSLSFQIVMRYLLELERWKTLSEVHRFHAWRIPWVNNITANACTQAMRWFILRLPTAVVESWRWSCYLVHALRACRRSTAIYIISLYTACTVKYIPLFYSVTLSTIDNPNRLSCAWHTIQYMSYVIAIVRFSTQSYPCVLVLHVSLRYPAPAALLSSPSASIQMHLCFPLLYHLSDLHGASKTGGTWGCKIAPPPMVSYSFQP